MKDSSQDTLNPLHFTTLKYKWREKEIEWPLNSPPSHSPGCFNLIFNFKCSQSSVDCVHDLISLVTTSSAIKASYYNVFCACKVSSPVESEDSICFLTTGACISVKKSQTVSLCGFPEANEERLHFYPLWTGSVRLSDHEPEIVPATGGVHSGSSKTWQHDYNGCVFPPKRPISFIFENCYQTQTSQANSF